MGYGIHDEEDYDDEGTNRDTLRETPMSRTASPEFEGRGAGRRRNQRGMDDHNRGKKHGFRDRSPSVTHNNNRVRKRQRIRELGSPQPVGRQNRRRGGVAGGKGSDGMSLAAAAANLHPQSRPPQQSSGGSGEPPSIIPESILYLLSIIPPASLFTDQTMDVDVLMDLISTADLATLGRRPDMLGGGGDQQHMPRPPAPSHQPQMRYGSGNIRAGAGGARSSQSPPRRYGNASKRGGKDRASPPYRRRY